MLRSRCFACSAAATMQLQKCAASRMLGVDWSSHVLTLLQVPAASPTRPPTPHQQVPATAQQAQWTHSDMPVALTHRRAAAADTAGAGHWRRQLRSKPEVEAADLLLSALLCWALLC